MSTLLYFTASLSYFGAAISAAQGNLTGTIFLIFSTVMSIVLAIIHSPAKPDKDSDKTEEK